MTSGLTLRNIESKASTSLKGSCDQMNNPEKVVYYVFRTFVCRVRFKNCAHSNLNGLNTADETVDSKRRIWWRGILDRSGERAALDTAEMMIRLKEQEEVEEE